MQVNEQIKKLLTVKNQEAEVKIIVGNEIYAVKDIQTNSQPVIIEEEKK